MTHSKSLDNINTEAASREIMSSDETLPLNKKLGYLYRNAKEEIPNIFSSSVNYDLEHVDEGIHVEIEQTSFTKLEDVGKLSHEESANGTTR
jgi:superfamily I DNA and/or RNA helicase